jgi:hypothetical protein
VEIRKSVVVGPVGSGNDRHFLVLNLWKAG